MINNHVPKRLSHHFIFNFFKFCYFISHKQQLLSALFLRQAVNRELNVLLSGNLDPLKLTTRV